MYWFLTLNEVSGTPSLNVDGSMPWWWMVCTLIAASSTVWTTWPWRARMGGDGNGLSSFGPLKAQYSTSLPSEKVSLSLNTLRSKTASGRTRPGVAGPASG